MSTPVQNILASFAAALATAASIDIAAQPRPLFVLNALETAAANPYTTILQYAGIEPGNFPGTRFPIVRIQLATRGTDAAAALQRATNLHEAMLEESGTPWLHHVMPGKTIGEEGEIDDDDAGDWYVWVRQFITGPGLVGRDGERYLATSNFEAQIERKAHG